MSLLERKTFNISTTISLCQSSFALMSYRWRDNPQNQILIWISFCLQYGIWLNETTGEVVEVSSSRDPQHQCTWDNVPQFHNAYGMNALKFEVSYQEYLHANGTWSHMRNVVCAIVILAHIRMCHNYYTNNSSYYLFFWININPMFKNIG